MPNCPCGFGEPYDACCARFHAGRAQPPTALTLMRARYGAFAVHDRDFLLATWHSETRPATLEPDADREWTHLQILGHTGGGMLEATGTVEFSARYRQDGTRGEQRENSRFVREEGQWRYLDAVGGPA